MTILPSISKRRKMSLNKAMLIGNVGRDPEVRYIESGAGNPKVATFPLATTEKYRDRSGNIREITEWHNIVTWRSTADVVEKFVRKGTQVYVEGRIRTRSWDDQSGAKKYVTEIVADTLQLLGRRTDNPATVQTMQQTAATVRPAQTTTAPAAPAVPDIEDDDLPF